jgi:hypothetical protein
VWEEDEQVSNVLTSLRVQLTASPSREGAPTTESPVKVSAVDFEWDDEEAKDVRTLCARCVQIWQQVHRATLSGGMQDGYRYSASTASVC